MASVLELTKESAITIPTPTASQVGQGVKKALPYAATLAIGAYAGSKLRKHLLGRHRGLGHREALKEEHGYSSITDPLPSSKKEKKKRRGEKTSSVLEFVKAANDFIIEQEPKFPPAESHRLESALAWARNHQMGASVEKKIQSEYDKTMSQRAILAAARV